MPILESVDGTLPLDLDRGITENQIAEFRAGLRNDPAIAHFLSERLLAGVVTTALVPDQRAPEVTSMVA